MLTELQDLGNIFQRCRQSIHCCMALGIPPCSRIDRVTDVFAETYPLECSVECMDLICRVLQHGEELIRELLPACQIDCYYRPVIHCVGAQQDLEARIISVPVQTTVHQIDLGICFQVDTKNVLRSHDQISSSSSTSTPANALSADSRPPIAGPSLVFIRLFRPAAIPRLPDVLKP